MKVALWGAFVQGGIHSCYSAINSLRENRKPRFMKEFTFIDLFAGIGGFHQAAKKLGGRCVFASEIDAYAQKTYKENYGIAPVGDIKKVESYDIPKHDILFAGFPCQPFSIIGSRRGFDDIRGTLFFEIARILKDKRPPMFILENVKQLATHEKGKTLDIIILALKEIGYTVHYNMLNALNYGLPQKRERLIIVGFLDHSIDFSFPSHKPMKSLTSILEDDSEVDIKYFASAEIVARRILKHKSKYHPSIWHENKSGNISSYPYSCALRATASYNYLLVNGKRRPTPREMLRLQGFPNSFKIVCSDAQVRKQAGNAVPVNIIEYTLKEVLNATAKAQRWEAKSTRVIQHRTNRVKFSIKRPPMLNFNDTMEQIGYNDNWISIL